MNRREFLRLMALAGGASAAMPAAAILNPLHGEALSLNGADFAVLGDASASGFPRIGIVSVGSGACGLLRQWQGGLPYLARSVAIDTNPFVLARSGASHAVRVGQSADKITDPKTLRMQAKAAKSAIRDTLTGLDLVWLVSTLGGTAGTGIAPIVADEAKALGIPVIAASITPFDFEGPRRNQIAQAGLSAINRRVTASIELPNEAFDTDDEDALLETVLGNANGEFLHLYRNVSSVLSQQGLIGVDIEDFRAVMAQGKGLVAFGHGQGDGLPGANTAFSAAANHQLLGVERLQNAKGVFVAIHLKSGSQPMNTIKGVMQSMSAVITDPQALMIYGAVIEPDLPSDLSISILAAL